MNLKSISVIAALCLITVGVVPAEPMSFQGTDEILRVAASGTNVWAGWNDRIMYTTNSGATWDSYDTTNGLPKRNVSSMLVDGTDFWAGLYYDSTVPAGYDISLNGGLLKSDISTSQWELLDPYAPTFRGNIPYGLIIYNDTIWSGNWLGGLVQSIDGGHNWDQVYFNVPFNDPVDSLHHRIYAVMADENDLWAGSENGLNHSTDRGENWEFIRHDEQDGSSIGANKIIGLGLRQTGKGSELWATTWRQIATGGEFGVSISSDAGQTWRRVLTGLQAWSLCFFDNDVFVPTDSGLWYSNDDGYNFTNLTDAEISWEIEQFGVAVTSDSIIWLGTSDGLYYGDYDGQSWDRVDLVALDADDEDIIRPDDYSLGQNYPNPFNPATTIPVSLTRADNISLVIYNILGRRVQTLYSGHLGPGDYFFDWDGKSSSGSGVSGGVYFYELINSRGTETRSMLLIK